MNWEGDYISIQEIDSNGNQKLVSYLTGLDRGPRSEFNSIASNWDKKFISISTNRMSIDFKSDDIGKNIGFSAIIYFTPIPNKECDSWLDMNKKILISPNYPQTHHYSMKCIWLITVDHDYHITLDLSELYVRQLMIISSYYYYMK